jgi:hypothetical protein
MELNNQSFTSKMIRKIGEFVLATPKKQSLPSSPSMKRPSNITDDEDIADVAKRYTRSFSYGSEVRDSSGRGMSDAPERASTTTDSTIAPEGI